VTSDKNEYKKAAKRHLDTCRYMLDHLDEIKPADKRDVNDILNDILMDIYYLSGYIIECATNLGLLYFKLGNPPTNHYFKGSIDTLDEHKNLGLNSIIKESKLRDTLYGKWNTKFRYEEFRYKVSKYHDEEKTLSREDVERFYSLSISIYKCIIDHTKGIE
jgi:hypothetical protein